MCAPLEGAGGVKMKLRTCDHTPTERELLLNLEFAWRQYRLNSTDHKFVKRLDDLVFDLETLRLHKRYERKSYV